MTSQEDAARLVQEVFEERMQEKLMTFSSDMSYVAGNATLKALKVQEKIEEGGRIAAALEASGAAGKTAWGLASDLARQDYVCTGLCSVALCCESVAAISRIAPIPYRLQVYVGCKMVSKGVMTFRNLCKNAKGELTPC